MIKYYKMKIQALAYAYSKGQTISYYFHEFSARIMIIMNNNNNKLINGK